MNYSIAQVSKLEKALEESAEREADIRNAATRRESELREKIERLERENAELITRVSELQTEIIDMLGRPLDFIRV